MGKNWKNKERPIRQINSIFIGSGLDNKLYNEISKWDSFYKSPFSTTIYSKKKRWNITELGTLRISDHWNFESREEIHCKTIQPVENNTYWSLGIYDEKTKKWNILMSYPKNFSDENKKEIKQSREIRKNNDPGLQKRIQYGKVIAKLVDDRQITATIKVRNTEDIISGVVEKLGRNRLRVLQDSGETFLITNNDLHRSDIELKNGEEVFNYWKNCLI